ncbi:hypothetical protein [Streptomyces enissocaesilis]|uniref:Uncharacterized protein n=1 Tax=Streptomyces enissocaesilis TaxID=332589 RepID=A0ABN3WVQ5_9ACTN
MTDLDRLLLESVPDGTFGGARTLHRRGRTTEPARQPRQPDPRAAEHLAELAAAIARPRRPLIRDAA